ncbi:UNKNOWN [Stylonychia lemnae]|uniref:Uncharacterized protein n=1 Tax=Stylonychia lemnae TaxID=5949 RepID=A0A078APE0_STYLE|nr:UNKNOWN [Stylonychia lemnae]|eukprot:CDW84235.1 UNKNOWN [Stylonychia lemnae]
METYSKIIKSTVIQLRQFNGEVFVLKILLVKCALIWRNKIKDKILQFRKKIMREGFSNKEDCVEISEIKVGDRVRIELTLPKCFDKEYNSNIIAGEYSPVDNSFNLTLKICEPSLLCRLFPWIIAGGISLAIGFTLFQNYSNIRNCNNAEKEICQPCGNQHQIDAPVYQKRNQIYNA